MTMTTGLASKPCCPERLNWTRVVGAGVDHGVLSKRLKFQSLVIILPPFDPQKRAQGLGFEGSGALGLFRVQRFRAYQYLCAMYGFVGFVLIFQNPKP